MLDGKPASAWALLQRLVMTLPYWRNDSELERVDAHLEISAALGNEECHEITISDDGWKHLRVAMSIQNQGVTVNFAHELNLFYMKLMQAVLRAEQVPHKT